MCPEVSTMQARRVWQACIRSAWVYDMESLPKGNEVMRWWNPGVQKHPLSVKFLNESTLAMQCEESLQNCKASQSGEPKHKLCFKIDTRIPGARYQGQDRFVRNLAWGQVYLTNQPRSWYHMTAFCTDLNPFYSIHSPIIPSSVGDAGTLNMRTVTVLSTVVLCD